MQNQPLIQTAIEGISYALETLDELFELDEKMKGCSCERTTEMALLKLDLIADKLMVPTSSLLSLEDERNQSYQEKSRTILVKVWDTIKRMLNWLVSLIDDVAEKINARSHIVTNSFTNTRRMFEQARADGLFRGPRSGFIRNSLIFKVLNIKGRLQANSVIVGVGKLNILTPELDRYMTDIARELNKFNIQAVIRSEQIDIKELEIFRFSNKALNSSELASYNLGQGYEAYRSDTLLGNKVFLFVDYSDQATRGMIKGTGSGESVHPFLESKYGLHFVDEPGDYNDKVHNLVALNEAEIHKLLLATQGFLNTINQSDYYFRDIKGTLKRLIHQFSSIPEENLDRESIKIIRDFVTGSSKQAIDLIRDYKSYSLTVINAVSSLCRVSMSKYNIKEGEVNG